MSASRFYITYNPDKKYSADLFSKGLRANIFGCFPLPRITQRLNQSCTACIFLTGQHQSDYSANITANEQLLKHHFETIRNLHVILYASRSCKSQLASLQFLFITPLSKVTNRFDLTLHRVLRIGFTSLWQIG